MGLTTDMLKKIKQEIADDPDGLGYAGKTDAAIAVLLNTTIIRQRIVEDAYPPPINRILSGMGQGPNTVTAIEVGQAKSTI